MSTNAVSDLSTERGQAVGGSSSSQNAAAALSSPSPERSLPLGASSMLRPSGEPVVAARKPRWHDRLRVPWRGRSERASVSQYHHGDTYNTTNTHTAPVTTIKYANSVSMVSQSARENLFEKLPRHPDLGEEWAEYSKDSRSGDLKEAWGWADDQEGELVLWIHGGPEQGKSTLARQLRDELRSKDRLAAAIFLTLLESKSQESVIRLIGGEIGLIHRSIAPMVIEAIDQCYGTSPSSHIEKIVCDPLLTLQLREPLIVIMDGITEWKLHAQFIEQLALLAPHTSLVRFILLGRSKPAEGRYKHIPIRSYALAPISVEVMAAHINAHFDAIEWKDGGRPTPDNVLRLAGLAEGQFMRVEEVVSTIRDLPPSNYQDISEPIFKLGLSVWEGSEKSGSTVELEHSIMLDRVALALRPPGHLKRHHSLNNLAVALGSRYKKKKPPEDLEERILLHREALALRLPGHPDRHHSCYNLANSLYPRFLKDGQVGDLDEGISLGREALQLRPEGHPRRLLAVYNQQLYLHDRFKKKGAVEDLREATALAEEAFSICLKDHQYYATLPGKISSYKAELARVEALSGTKHASEEQ